jgi:hypothetical protein
MIIAALDISSFRLDCCILADDQPPMLMHYVLGKGTAPLLQRLRKIADAIASFDLEGCDLVAVEKTYRNPSLLRTEGAIVAAIPAGPKVKVVTPKDWRDAIGAVNTKAAGHEAVWEALSTSTWPTWIHPTGFDRILDEHELDALGLALSQQKLLAANASRATR